ncbi:hypothetical protein A8C56_03005 [Niabella ginsenosidivorans]|uniref:Helix-turn-helix domain-containing protein n=1 Tax=Niabella ginsenosidivorans TaxID=1176587 RepID=A0A1A9I030_9BACT|nr:hypothetical protein [Niabella ginsenosidivorans]ANH80090.1 hypothetical protein A8C56_03005 [Niabella ginsenosidivorans]
MEMISNKVLSKKQALELTGFKESYFDKLNALGMIPGCSKPTGKTCFFDREILEDWLLSKPKQTYKNQQTAAANYISSH